MPNIPYTGKKYLYRVPRRVKKNYGVMMSVIELARLSQKIGPINSKGLRGINRQTIDQRLQMGWTAWAAVHLPVATKEKKTSKLTKNLS